MSGISRTVLIEHLPDRFSHQGTRGTVPLRRVCSKPPQQGLRQP